MKEIQEIRALDGLRRYPAIREQQIPQDFLDLGASLQPFQRTILARIINDLEEEGNDMSLMRHCLIMPSARTGDTRQAEFVISRHMDSRLYSKHTEGPPEPVEPIDEGVAVLFPHVGRHAVISG